MREIELRSDNAGGVAPDILAAVVAANTGSALAYGADEWTARLQQIAADVFEHPGLTVFPVVSGTAANALALASLCPPWGAVLCHESAHIVRSECGATSMFSGGAVMRGLPGDGTLLDGDSIRDVFATTRWGDPHHSQPAVLSLTSPTDFGAVYPVGRVAELTDREGARPASPSRRCPDRQRHRRARLHSRRADLAGRSRRGLAGRHQERCAQYRCHRVLRRRGRRAARVSDQACWSRRIEDALPVRAVEAYLTDGLWLRLASHANAAMARLAAD